jgi:RNA polymerase sigma-70 factor (ECF subfamily)
MGNESDRALVQRAQAGDAQAFAALVDRHAPRVRRLARQLVRGHADADDLAQDTFVRAYQALDRFDGRSEFFTWIYRIAVNLSLNRARSLSIRRSVPLDDPQIEGSVALLTRGSAEGVSGIDRRRVAAALLEELDRLPDALRVTLTLVCIDGTPQNEVAEILGCSVGTVGWRVHEARKRVRDGLRARGLDETADLLGGNRGRTTSGTNAVVVGARVARRGGG